MKNENLVVDLHPTLASDPKQIELNIGNEERAACTKCHKEKALIEFHKNKGKPNGRQAHCKACTSKMKAAKYRKKVRKKEREQIIQASVCGKVSASALTDFSNTFAEVIRELIDHEKL